MSFSFRIDPKSLYWGITNDNDFGHTQTVSTNLKQGNSVKPELELIEKDESNILVGLYPELENLCNKHSKSKCRIRNILVFNKIFVNGKRLNTKYSFCIFTKEEVDTSKVHFGRVKLHYPINFSFSSFEFDIANREVLKDIQKSIGGFAYLVRAFDFLGPSSINFNVLVLGLPPIAYSKIFVNYKGDSAIKFQQAFLDVPDSYDLEILTMRKHKLPGIEEINPNNYTDACRFCSLLAKEKASRYLKERYLNSAILDISSQYPYALFDFEIIDPDGKHRYFIVNWTSGSKVELYLSISRFRFIQSALFDCSLLFVSRVLDEAPSIIRISLLELNRLKREMSMIKFWSE